MKFLEFKGELPQTFIKTGEEEVVLSMIHLSRDKLDEGIAIRDQQRVLNPDIHLIVLREFLGVKLYLLVEDLADLFRIIASNGLYPSRELRGYVTILPEKVELKEYRAFSASLSLTPVM